MSKAEERVPPHDLDAEATVLSALLIDPNRFAEVQHVVRPSMFYSDANRRIAETIWELEASGQPIDAPMVASHLRDRDRLAQVGGTPYLAQLTDAIPAIAHAVEHARIVQNAARIRGLQATCRMILAESYSALHDAENFLQDAEAKIFASVDTGARRADSIAVIGEAVENEYQELKSRAKADPFAEKHANGWTGIEVLDETLSGLVNGVPYVIAARPGHGKTALAYQIAESVASSGELVVFLSQEMPLEQLAQRSLAQAANIEPGVIRSGLVRDEDWSAIVTALGVIEKLPIAVDDRAGQTVAGARSAVRRGVQKLRSRGHAGRLGLVVLDYLQIMGGERRGGDSRATEVSDNCHGMTKLAKEFGCPLLLLSQLNRQIDNRPDKRPKLSDLGESGAIEADAYGVIFIYRQDCYRPETEHDGLADLIVAKHRNGRMGTLTARYLPSTRFVAV